MPGLDRLHPVVVHHIVNTLGWTSLRPLQEEAVGPVLDGTDALLLAPTAGGKTEAAVFPLLTAMETQRWAGLSVIYVCPLKALLNNLLPRLAAYAGWLGRRAAIWHGDVGASARQRLLRDPPDVLLTTPESLEAMLISLKVDHGALFAGLRAVVVDEVHAFAGDDRGWHLLAVLERLARVAGRPIQRIGLSATVGNPDELLGWLQGSGRGQRPGVVVAPGVGSARRRSPAGDVELDYVGSVSNAATVIASLHRGEKRLVFCDSRQLVEEIGAALRERGVTTFLSHASLPLDERRRAEQAFAEARDCVIVATSTLELGVDVGDLDRVIQVNDPPTRRRVPPADRAHRPAAGQPPQLPVPRAEPGCPAVVRRAAAPVGAGIRRAGGGAAGAPAHRRPAAARLVPAGAPDRQPAVERGVERAGAVRPQRRAHPAVPGGAGVPRPGRRAAVHRARGRAAFRAPALHGDDRGVHRAAAVHRAGRAAGDRADRPHAAHREDRRAAAAAARRAQLEGDLDRLEAPTLLCRARRGRWQGPLAHARGIGGQLRAVARGPGGPARRGPAGGADPAGQADPGRGARASIWPPCTPAGTVITRDGEDVRWWTWAGYRANATLAATLSHLTDSVQRFDDASLRMRGDLTLEMWKAGTADASERLCLPDVDERALAGLKFSEALPERLATATLAARIADLDSAVRVIAEQARFTVVDSRA